MFGNKDPNKARQSMAVPRPERDIPGLGDLRVESDHPRTDSTSKIVDRAIWKR